MLPFSYLTSQIKSVWQNQEEPRVERSVSLHLSVVERMDVIYKVYEIGTREKKWKDYLLQFLTKLLKIWSTASPSSRGIMLVGSLMYQLEGNVATHICSGDTSGFRRIS